MKKKLIKTSKKNIPVRKTKRRNMTKVVKENTLVTSTKQKETEKTSNKKGKTKSSATVLKPMEVSEVNKTTEAIKNSSSDIQRRVTELSLVKGWEVIGYSSFKEYVEGELSDISLGYDALNRLRRIGECIFTVAGMKYVGHYKGDAIMCLVKLDSKQQKQVWKLLIQQSGEKQVPSTWLNIKRVERAIEQLGYKHEAETDATSDDKTVEVAKPKQVELYESKVEMAFHKNLKETHADDPIFARRLMNSIGNTLNKNNNLLLCKNLLKKHEKDDVCDVIKDLKKYFH